MHINTRTLILLIPLIYLLAALHSVGYHHPDEHYQIVEFAGLKGGWNKGADLAWEYDSQIRPTMQPMLALSVFKHMNVVGFDSPFQLSAGLRILSAIFACFCICCFVRSFLPLIKESYRTAFVLFSFLLWFLPVISVRFSSETWAGLTLLLSVAFLNSSDKDNATKRKALFYAGIGVLWGLCFEFRYQMAIPLFGLFLWLFVVKNEKLSNLFSLISGGAIVVAACFLLDSWYYGDWVFAPWNYFKINIIDDVASNFGVSPWYYYFDEILNRPTPLIGLLIVVALIVFLIRRYRNIVAWCIIPFLLIHSIIPHKELRFLFPVAYFVPLIMFLAFQEIPEKWIIPIKKVALYPLFAIVLIINTGGLVLLSFKPALNGNIEILQYIHNHYDNIKLYTPSGSNPYTLSEKTKGLTPRFYANKKVEIKKLEEILYSKEQKEIPGDALVMIWSSSNYKKNIEQLGFHEVHRSIPKWIEKIDRFYKVYMNYDFIFVLYAQTLP